MQALLLILEHDRPQLHHVFPTVKPLFTLILDMRLIADIPQNAVKQDRDWVFVGAFAPALKHSSKAHQAGSFPAEGFLPGWIAVRQPQQNFAGTQVFLVAQRHKFFDGLIADTPRRQVDHPAQADLIQRVIDQAHEGDYVLHLTPSVETLRPHKAIAQPHPPESFFQKARLRVGAIHDCKRPRGYFLVGNGFLDGTHDHIRFFAVVLSNQEVDLFTFRRVGEEFLGSTVAVMVDNRHGTIQNCLRGAVVLLEQDGFCVFEVLLEAQDVAIIRAAPAVDALVFVTDHIEVAVFLCQQAQNGVLCQVGVLEFVHQDVFKLVPIRVAHHRMSFENLVGIDQHVIKVHGVVFDQSLLILDVKPPHLLIAEVFYRIVIRLD